ncbi:MAG: hypothetical protein MUF69_11665, partial [Desulfobacterota bacterium]|nr:hypothetical protein [Thermodesulfobacteriota bacterium]
TATTALARIAGELHSGQFASAILPLMSREGAQHLAVSAIHGDGATLPMTGKIFLFGPGDLENTPALESVRAFPGTARDMHLGTFLAAGQGRQGSWLAAGAPTELENTGSVRLFHLSAPAGFYPARRGKGVH